jgi:hypothetical protein
MMSTHQPMTLDTRYCQLPGAHTPHPRSVATVAHLRRALASLEMIANIRAKARKV